MNKTIISSMILMPILVAIISFFAIKSKISIIIVIICGVLTSFGLRLLIYDD